MRIVMIAGVLAAGVLVSGCATITRGTSQKFNIESTPAQAEVTLSNGQQCITPCKLKLKRKPGFTATVKKPGYKTQTVTVDSKLGGGGIVAGAGNVILGGVVGGIVDGTNGSMNNLSPNPLQVTLVPEDVPAAAGAPDAVAPTEAKAPADVPATDGEAATDGAPNPGQQ